MITHASKARRIASFTGAKKLESAPRGHWRDEKKGAVVAKMSKQGQLKDRLRPVLVRTDDGWKVVLARYTTPIGVRLWKRTTFFPDYPTDGSLEECAEALEQWSKWLSEEYELSLGKRRKK